MTRELTTAQLARVGRAAVRAWLDHQSGLGVPEPVGRLLPEDRGEASNGERRQIRYSEMGPAVLVRLGGERAAVFVAIATQQGPELVVGHLRCGPSGWRLEAAELANARDVPEGPPEIDEVARACSPEPPRHFTGVLGSPPADEDAWERWLRSAAVIDVYREWNDISGSDRALGPPPRDPSSAQEHERAVAYVRDQIESIRAVRGMSEPDRQGPDTGRSR